MSTIVGFLVGAAVSAAYAYVRVRARYHRVTPASDEVVIQVTLNPGEVAWIPRATQLREFRVQ